ncbi:MAG: hypothetical protein E7047_10260 [Lentisphaerae bacterium]|nr:hypothetical protein [Lentisphaerota bacterium]
MKKLFTFAFLLLAIGSVTLKAAEAENQSNILDKINSLPMYFGGKTVSKSGFTVQTPYFWQFKEKNDIYHAAIIFGYCPKFCEKHL